MHRLALAALLGAAAFVPASAATYTVIHSFCQDENFKCRSGKMPFAGLVADAKGDLYGTTTEGGQNGSGVIFQLHRTATEWKYKVLHKFQCAETCAEGNVPIGALIVDKRGSLYGTASQGGSSFGGTAFKLTRSPGNSWTYSVLINFCPETGSGCVQGQVPNSQLAYAGSVSGVPYDGVSPLYGASLFPGSGLVYRLTHSGDAWSGEVVHGFCQSANCADGAFPVGQVQVDDAGEFLYGVTNGGGNGNGAGVTYKIALATGDETVLHTFCSAAECTDGQGAGGGVTLSGKTLYGTTPLGGGNGGGALFTLNANSGKQKLLYSFCEQQPNCSDGQKPNGAPVLAGGSVVGTASGGIDFNGVVYRVGPGKAETVLHTFCQETDCVDGAAPAGGVAVDAAGTIYGVTQRGGSEGWGVVYSVTP
jgi:uncharacterized repeat protein (TIGR03803 family)